MTTLTKEMETIKKVVFIQKASLCEFNDFWICGHGDSKGKECTELCNCYNVKWK